MCIVIELILSFQLPNWPSLITVPFNFQRVFFFLSVLLGSIMIKTTD